MNNLPSRTAAFVVLLGLSVLTQAASSPAGSPETPHLSPPRPQPASTRRMVERLAALDRDADPLAIPFFADKAAKFFEAKIAAATSTTERISLQLPYAGALLNNGQSEQALIETEKYEHMIKANGLTLRPGEEPLLLLNKAICCLRLGEQENCLANHNGDSCLLPIRGGGVHQNTRGSRKAIEFLEELLDLQPTPYAAWLYNIAHMTLGEYPDGVAPEWRIPPEVFNSEYDIKRFPDVAGLVGLAVDEMSGGVVMDDFDNDGWLDIMTSGSGLHSQLRCFHNNGDGTFAETTDAAGLTGLTGGLNLIQGDYNNDGRIDVLVLRGGWLGGNGRYPNSLLRNNGDNTFTDVTEESGLLSFHPTQSAVWFDYDGDGWLDIFVANESVPDSGAADPCELFHNNRDGTFTECAAANGLAVVDWIKAVVTGDFNNDGRPDLYLSSLVGPNLLLRNDGPAGPGNSPGTPWRFTNVAAAAGVTGQTRSFSCWFFDYDNDGWSDILVTGYRIQDAGDILVDYLGSPPARAETARLFHNNHDGTFADVTTRMGLHKILHAMGANFGDLDNDGWLDF
ncbi:MAG TPA: VCBS repeat-containing protein, partial [Lacunisphaera sp.]